MPLQVFNNRELLEIIIWMDLIPMERKMQVIDQHNLGYKFHDCCLVVTGTQKCVTNNLVYDYNTSHEEWLCETSRSFTYLSEYWTWNNSWQDTMREEEMAEDYISWKPQDSVEIVGRFHGWEADTQHQRWEMREVLKT